MTGQTTVGLAANLTGEGWHYVGGAGEPAFGADFANVTGSASLGFRLVGLDTVEIYGVVQRTGSAGTAIFTLPVGYRPLNASAFFPIQRDSGGTLSIRLAIITTSGQLGGTGSVGDVLSISGRYPLSTPVSA